jgi:hypothetical protein
MESKCQKCSKTVQPGWLECPYCGEELVKEKMCPSCGKQVQPDWVKCPYCRTAIVEPQTVNPAQANFCASCGSPITGSSFFKCQECMKLTCLKCRAQHPDGIELPICKTCGWELLKPLWDKKREEELIGATVVEVSKLVRPGAALSGSVKFASGVKADWVLDQMGRLGLEKPTGKPTPEDIKEFQVELQKKLRGT